MSAGIDGGGGGALDRPPMVSRRLIYYGLAAFMGFFVILVIFLTAGGGIEQQQAAERVAQEQARVTAVVGGAQPTAEDVQSDLERQRQDALRARAEAERAARAEQARLAQALPPAPTTAPGGAKNEALERMLRDMERGQAQENQAGFRFGEPLAVPGAQRGPAAGAAMTMPEVFDVGQGGRAQERAMVDRPAGAVGLERTPTPEQAQERQQAAQRAADGAPLEAYELTRAQTAPTSYLLSQGAILDVVLVTAIDTQNPGPIQFRLVSDVFDSRGERRLLIPRGTRFIASLGGTPRVGLDRVPIIVNRVIFTDGRAVSLDGAAITDPMGQTGAAARHHSNLWRAIGPSALVALIGAWADRELGTTAAPAASGQPQSATQSVTQQILPRIEERIANRFGAAQPYYTIDAGVRLNLVVNQDLALPPYVSQR